MKQERGYSTQWQEKKRNAKTFTAKKVTGFFFCQLWFYMLQSHNDLNHKLKGGHEDNKQRR